MELQMKKLYANALNKIIIPMLTFSLGLLFTTISYGQCPGGCVLPDPAGQVYIASSDGTGDGSCTTAGEFVEICYTAACPCDTAPIDLSGYTIEDSVSGPSGTQPTSIQIDAGSLLPGECLIIYSGYLDGSITTPPTGSMGSTFTISSPRGSCPIWNSGGDTASLVDAGGVTVDTESTTGGISTYDAPLLTCPPECTTMTSCPDLSAQAPPAVITSESTCSTEGGVAGEDGGGALAPPVTACPPGSTIEYSINGGMTWSGTLPTYMQTTSITVLTRCVCTSDMTMVSPTNMVTTTPGACPTAGCEANEGTFPGTVGGASNN